jgi:hypothetical protein
MKTEAMHGRRSSGSIVFAAKGKIRRRDRIAPRY